MAKRHFWATDYNRSADLIEITVKDPTGAKIESWTLNIQDKKTATKVMRILKEQYNFSPEIPPKKAINTKDKDLDWLKEGADPFS